ncbi:isochorismatase family protein [Croceicoccus mobilis]|uniref:N-carbamoylsarcosine amidase n=1 Tax=Croceicoccus mobilis TaxID=1703339 RepID=A0A916Z789_9SPHN|nr:isochorismatase family protein [Croceicoccus mobilis]GGD79476.1 N-carbamoylsarcosine amidase [Croceicoccus mobilis]
MSDLQTSYAGAFDGHLRPGKKAALVIVDVVAAYLDPASDLYCEAAGSALSVNERLLAAAHDAGVPVIFTNVEYQNGGTDGGQFYRKVPALRAFLKGSPLGAFPATLRPGESDLVVTKQYASAFFGTSLAATLNGMGIDTVFVTGFSTSGCVRASALDALQHGFIPFVVSDACADRRPEPHEANLFDLQAKYAEVIDEGKALALIRQLGA